MAQNHSGPSILFSKPSKTSSNEITYNDDDSDEEPQVRMRVGDLYQAVVPVWNEDAERVDGNEGMKIWCPNPSITDAELQEYCVVARDKHQYNAEQALGMLLWHNYDITKSLSDMANFTPMPDDWTEDEKALFSQAYQMHGKSFRKIQELLPFKEINQLVKYYYLWKKTQAKSSLINKQAKRILSVKTSPGNDNDVQIIEDSDEGSNESIENQKSQPNAPSENQTMKNESKSIGMKLLTQNNGRLHNVSMKQKQQSNKPKQTPQWSESEMLLVVEGVRKYGQNYKAISDIILTKTPEQVREFISIHHSNLGMTQVLKDYERNTKVDDNSSLVIST